MQPLPPVLSSVFNEKLLVDIDQVDDIILQNVNQLQHLETKLNVSLSMHTSIILALRVCIGIVWYKIGRRLNLPNVRPQTQLALPTILLTSSAGRVYLRRDDLMIRPTLPTKLISLNQLLILFANFHTRVRFT